MFAIVNRASGVVLDIHRPQIHENATSASQWGYRGSPNQLWDVIEAEGGWIWLRNVESRKALVRPPGFARRNGTIAAQWGYAGGASQQWRMENTNDGWFWLRNRETNQALEVRASTVAQPGGRVHLWAHTGLTNQQWRIESAPTDAQFSIGPFKFDRDISAEQTLKLYERHRAVHKLVNSCERLTTSQRAALRSAYQRSIQHSRTTTRGALGESLVRGSRIWINFENLFPRGDEEIGRTLIHEMMHCAGFDHPNRQPTDTPGDAGPYFGTPPLLAELCVSDRQSEVGCVQLCNGRKCRVDHGASMSSAAIAAGNSHHR